LKFFAVYLEEKMSSVLGVVFMIPAHPNYDKGTLLIPNSASFYLASIIAVIGVLPVF
jgi:hypothetical protein